MRAVYDQASAVCVWHSIPMTAQHWMCFAKFYQASMLWTAHQTPSVNVIDFINEFRATNFAAIFYSNLFVCNFALILLYYKTWACESVFWLNLFKFHRMVICTNISFHRLFYYHDEQPTGVINRVKMLRRADDLMFNQSFINQTRCEPSSSISLWFDLWSERIVFRHLLLNIKNTDWTDVSILLKNNKF